MARPVKISEEQILEAARIVFVRDGINATTKDIARQACVSEGSLFRRFPTKEALFIAAVFFPPMPSWVRELDELAGKGDAHENLIHIFREMVRFAQEILPLVRLAWGSSAYPPKLGSDREETAGIRDCGLLAKYLKQEIEGGRLRPCNPEAVARMLFGACINLVLDHLMLNQPLTQQEIDAFVRSLVDALWHGTNPVSG
jgi:AcrR family transcriptional regulator